MVQIIFITSYGVIGLVGILSNLVIILTIFRYIHRAESKFFEKDNVKVDINLKIFIIQKTLALGYTIVLNKICIYNISLYKFVDTLREATKNKSSL